MTSINRTILGAIRARAGSQGSMWSTTASQFTRSARTRVTKAIPVFGKISGLPAKSTGGSDGGVFMRERFVIDRSLSFAKYSAYLIGDLPFIDMRSLGYNRSLA